MSSPHDATEGASLSARHQAGPAEDRLVIPAAIGALVQFGMAKMVGGEAESAGGQEGGSPVPRRGRSKVTSAKVARKASSALRDGRSSSRTKSIAASALAQAKGNKKGK